MHIFTNWHERSVLECQGRFLIEQWTELYRRYDEEIVRMKIGHDAKRPSEVMALPALQPTGTGGTK